MTAWATAYLAADEQCRIAFEALRNAKAMRCPDLDSGGAQCTADAAPEHQHRYDDADLPGWDPDQF